MGQLAVRVEAPKLWGQNPLGRFSLDMQCFTGWPLSSGMRYTELPSESLATYDIGQKKGVLAQCPEMNSV